MILAVEGRGDVFDPILFFGAVGERQRHRPLRIGGLVVDVIDMLMAARGQAASSDEKGECEEEALHTGSVFFVALRAAGRWAVLRAGVGFAAFGFAVFGLAAFFGAAAGSLAAFSCFRAWRASLRTFFVSRLRTRFVAFTTRLPRFLPTGRAAEAAMTSMTEAATRSTNSSFSSSVIACQWLTSVATASGVAPSVGCASPSAGGAVVGEA